MFDHMSKSEKEYYRHDYVFLYLAAGWRESLFAPHENTISRGIPGINVLVGTGNPGKITGGNPGIPRRDSNKK